MNVFIKKINKQSVSEETAEILSDRSVQPTHTLTDHLKH